MVLSAGGTLGIVLSVRLCRSGP